MPIPMSIERNVMNGFAKTGIGRVTFALLSLSPAIVALGVLFGLLDSSAMVTIFLPLSQYVYNLTGTRISDTQKNTSN